MGLEFEDMAKHLAQLNHNGSSLIDWKELADSRSETKRLSEKLIALVVNLQDTIEKNFDRVELDLQNYDLKGLSAKSLESSSVESSFSDISQFFSVEDEKISLNEEELASRIFEKKNPLIQLNSLVQAKIYEQVEWVDSLLSVLTQDERGNESKEVTAAIKQTPIAEVSTYKTIAVFNKDKLSELVDKIEVQFMPGTNYLITIQTYQQILDYSIELAKEQYTKLTYNNRKERRLVMSTNKLRYVELIMQLTDDTEELMDEAFIKISQRLGLNRDVIQKVRNEVEVEEQSEAILYKSEMILSKQGMNDQLLSMQVDARDRLKESLPESEKSVGMEDIDCIMNNQLGILRGYDDVYLPLLQLISKDSDIIKIANAATLITDDILFNQSALEEEDYQQALAECKTKRTEGFCNRYNEIQKAFQDILCKVDFTPDGKPIMEYFQLADFLV